jgi:large subunit ribosomal protein L21
MYAIIRVGGKQAKVREGDVIDVERLKTSGVVTFAPLLLVRDDGSVISDRGALEKATVTAEIVGEHRGDKVDIFKYKPKSGYRRRQGHRQTYTTLQVTKIVEGAAKKRATKAKKAAPAETDEPDSAVEAAADDQEA